MRSTIGSTGPRRGRAPTCSRRSGSTRRSPTSPTSARAATSRATARSTSSGPGSVPSGRAATSGCAESASSCGRTRTRPRRGRTSTSATRRRSSGRAAAVVGINTTAMIEAAILEKSVLTVLVPSFAQEATLHFHHLLEENGGFLHVATDLTEHERQLSAVLDEDEAGAARRRAFVASFVRPAGLDRPAAPIAAVAIEELAASAVDRRTGPGTLLLRGALSVEAAVGSARRALRRRAAGA